MHSKAAPEAFEFKYKRDSNDPSCGEKLAVWCDAWDAAVDAA